MNLTSKKLESRQKIILIGIYLTPLIITTLILFDLIFFPLYPWPSNSNDYIHLNDSWFWTQWKNHCNYFKPKWFTYLLLNFSWILVLIPSNWERKNGNKMFNGSKSNKDSHQNYSFLTSRFFKYSTRIYFLLLLILNIIYYIYILYQYLPLGILDILEMGMIYLVLTPLIKSVPDTYFYRFSITNKPLLTSNLKKYFFLLAILILEIFGHLMFLLGFVCG